MVSVMLKVTLLAMQKSYLEFVYITAHCRTQIIVVAYFYVKILSPLNTGNAFRLCDRIAIYSTALIPEYIKFRRLVF